MPSKLQLYIPDWDSSFSADSFPDYFLFYDCARLDSACVPKLPQAAFEIGEANEISKETAIAAAPAALDTRYRVLFDQGSCAGISS